MNFKTKWDTLMKIGGETHTCIKLGQYTTMPQQILLFWIDLLNVKLLDFCLVRRKKTAFGCKTTTQSFMGEWGGVDGLNHYVVTQNLS